MSRVNMTHTGSFITKTLSALVITCALAAIHTAPAAAQTATKLDCKDCIKSKQIENGKIKGKDLKDEAVESSKIEDGAVTGSKIEDGAISMSKLGSDVQALGMSGVANLPPSAFVPALDIGFANLAGLGYINPLGSGVPIYCVTAAAPLPDGAVVNRMEAYVVDLSVDNVVILFGNFDPTNPVLAAAVNMATVTSSGSSAGVTTLSTTSITDPTVDLATRFYSVLACLPENSSFHGVRIFY